MLNTLIHLAIVGSAPLLCASPIVGVIAATLTATVTETLTIHLRPTASSGSINFAGFVIPSIFPVVSPSPSANIVGGVLAGVLSPSGSATGSVVSRPLSLTRPPRSLLTPLLSSRRSVKSRTLISRGCIAPF
ncbi:hypothetical protein B0H16DRAFT_392637 [Mycena metata]|uniref:Secreted protein n=1 Tax=Mycena metata TaxID=1033252 RepID=A0AAD7HH52_9AGAR|nr:hypothetical protein B0H16DRAFT_392637 [Mycena metata]